MEEIFIDFDEWENLTEEEKNDPNKAYVHPLSSMPNYYDEFDENGERRVPRNNYQFELITDEDGDVFFDQTKIPANINEVIGFSADFTSLSLDKKENMQYDSSFKVSDGNNGYKTFQVNIYTDQINTQVLIKFEYL
tara:strand:- start:2402 stop:2809 length:408 start_codon:yes stop_codon:yes gene_type:complete